MVNVKKCPECGSYETRLECTEYGIRLVCLACGKVSETDTSGSLPSR